MNLKNLKRLKINPNSGNVFHCNYSNNSNSLFDWIHLNKQKSIFTTSIELRRGKDEMESKMENGLVRGHAYSILDSARLKLKTSNEKVELLKLRNPWASTNWSGPWSANSRMWNQSKQIVDREKYYPKNNLKKGEFWISWKDWLTIFNSLNICYIPDERRGINYRIIGELRPGQNSPLDLEDMKKNYLKVKKTFQAKLIINSNELVLIQFLLDNEIQKKFYISLNIFKSTDVITSYKKLTAFSKRDRVAPLLPIQPGYTVECYRHNGLVTVDSYPYIRLIFRFLFELERGEYVVVFSAAPAEAQHDILTKFMLRACSHSISQFGHLN